MPTPMVRTIGIVLKLESWTDNVHLNSGEPFGENAGL